jgi:hypothetical protein
LTNVGNQPDKPGTKRKQPDIEKNRMAVSLLKLHDRVSSNTDLVMGIRKNMNS